MLDFVTTVEQLVADLKARDYGKAVADAGDLLKEVGGAITAFRNDPPAAAASPNLAARLARAGYDLAAECEAHKVQMVAVPTGGIDPAAVIAAIEAVIQLIDWWRGQHSPQPTAA